MTTLEEMRNLLTVAQAAEALDVTIQRVHQIIRDERLEAEMVAGRYFIEPESVELYRVARGQGRRRRSDYIQVRRMG